MQTKSVETTTSTSEGDSIPIHLYYQYYYWENPGMNTSIVNETMFVC